MKKTLTLIVLLLFALAACSTPATESVTDLLPGNDEPVPTEVAATEEPASSEEPVATAPTTDETGVASDEAANEEVAACDTAGIPAPTAGNVMIRFRNLSGTEIIGLWHDTSQSPALLTDYFQLEAREAYDQETFVDHEWLLRDEEGNTLQDYVASTEEKQCVTIYPHFEYEGEDGPENWAELSEHYETCSSGKEQSPIDLTNATMTDLENISFNYAETAVNIINNGHTIQVQVIEGSQIVINGETYSLIQFHFHAPSEHAVDSQGYPIEMHLVHRGANGNLAVVGVFIAEGAENTAFTPVWDQLPEEERGIIATGATVHITDLLPTDKTVYRYSGSLTTPPCSENVIWSVMKNPVEMSAGQIAAFNSIIEGNNRPLQPLDAHALQLDETP